MSRGGKAVRAKAGVRKDEGRKRKKCAHYIMVIVATSVFAAGFSYHFYNSKELSRTAELERTMNTVNKLTETNNVLQQNIAKVTKIISTYNPELPEGQQIRIAKEIYDMSVKYDNLDINLICATITHESARTWDAGVISPAGAIGLMQIMPATGAYLAELEGIPWSNETDILTNPIYNIRLGSRYLSTLIDLYEIDGGLAAYNGGLKRVEMWLAHNRNNRILWAETRNYIPAVLKYYDEFKNLGGMF